MVESSGKALCTDTVKPVNFPEQVQVEEDASGRPVSVRACSGRVVQSCHSGVPMESGRRISGCGGIVRQSTGYKKGMKHKEVVTDILDLWRIDDEWWRSEPVSRLYYAVLLISGQRMVLYKDLVNGRWSRVC